MGRVIDIHEFEVESLVVNRPTTVARKSHYLEDETQKRSFPNAQQTQHSSRSWKNTVSLRSLKVVILASRFNFLMVFVPAAILARNYLYTNEGLVFSLSLLGIIPLAERLGFITEQLAFFTGTTVRGLVNASFGNATELIISIYALKSGLIRVVRHSLLGSILSNILLGLGCAFYWNGDQVFNKEAAAVDSGLLLMAIMGLLLPSVLHYTRIEGHYRDSDLALSRFGSSVMLISYGCYLVYQIKSQWSFHNSGNERGGRGGGNGNQTEQVPQMSKWEAITWLVILTISIYVLSEYLIDNIVGASVVWGMPVGFVSVVFVPIAGNAAKHASAMVFPIKEKLDISLGLAVGSSTQITMFIIPFCVTLGWIMEVPLDLHFEIFETTTLFLTLLVVAFLLQDDTSNYYKGLMLMFCYLIIAASFYIHAEDPFSR